MPLDLQYPFPLLLLLLAKLLMRKLKELHLPLEELLPVHLEPLLKLELLMDQVQTLLELSQPLRVPLLEVSPLLRQILVFLKA